MAKFSPKPYQFVILGVILGLGGFFLILANPFGWKTLRPITENVNIPQPGIKTPPGKNLVAAPTPTLILPPGKQTYFVQGAETNISRISAVTVDPLDVNKGQNQTLTVKIGSKEPIATFNVVLNSDNGAKEYPLTLVSGDVSEGTWEAKYTVNDTTSKIYSFVFNIITKNGNKTVTTFPVR